MMYKLLKRPDKKVKRGNGVEFKPIMTLSDKYGGRVQFSYDDHCLVLSLKQGDGTYKLTPYIFPEALDAIKHWFAK